MNGMAASDKIFRLIDLADGKTDANETAKTGERAREEKGMGRASRREPVKEGERMAAELSGSGIFCRNLCFSYEPDREILRGVNLMIPEGKMTALVGESGCGKSTLAALSWDATVVLPVRFSWMAGSFPPGTKKLLEKDYIHRP